MSLNQSGFFQYSVAASKNYEQFGRIVNGGEYIGMCEYGDDYVQGIKEGGVATYLTICNEFIPQNGDLADIFSRQSNILEVGCGCGIGIEILSKKYPLCHFKGIDIDFRAIRKARQLFEKNANAKVEFYVGDAGEFYFKERFDLIFMLWVLHEIENPSKLLETLGKYLKEHGQLLILEVPYPDFPLRREPSQIRTFCGLQFGEVLQGSLLMAPDLVLETMRNAGYCKIEKMVIHDSLYAYQGFF